MLCGARSIAGARERGPPSRRQVPLVARISLDLD
jgi:hypothetical protein